MLPKAFLVAWFAATAAAEICTVPPQADWIKKGAEIQVNTYTNKNQQFPAVSGLSDGGSVVVWDSLEQDGHEKGVFGQMYNGDSTSRGGEFLINTHTDRNQRYPSVSGLSCGGFAVTWTSYLQDGSRDGVFGQVYNNDGSKRGGEFQVNTHSFEGQLNSHVAGLTTGGFVVVWEDRSGLDGSGAGIFGQIFTPDADKVGGQFQVNVATLHNQRMPAASSLNTGFVVCWDSESPTSMKVVCRLYDESGTAAGGEISVTTPADPLTYKGDPMVAGLKDGGFIVVWNYATLLDQNFFDVYAQRYTATGTPLGLKFRVHEFVQIFTDQLAPGIAALGNGGYVITWSSSFQDGSGFGVYQQKYNADSSKRGGEQLVNTQTSLHQWMPSVSSLGHGGFFVVWMSALQDGSERGVFGQFYHPTIEAPEVDVRVNGVSVPNALGAPVLTSPQGVKLDQIPPPMTAGKVFFPPLPVAQGASVTVGCCKVGGCSIFYTGYSCKPCSQGRNGGINAVLLASGWTHAYCAPKFTPPGTALSHPMVTLHRHLQDGETVRICATTSQADYIAFFAAPFVAGNWCNVKPLPIQPGLNTGKHCSDTCAPGWNPIR